MMYGLKGKILIEEATINNAKEIIDVINTSNREAFGRIIPEEYFREPVITLQEYKESLEMMTFYVCKQRGVAVAVAALTIEDEYTGRIRWVYVLPNFQKQGIGSTLVHHLERVAKERGLRKTRLITDNNAEWAIRFYKNLGYILINKVPNPWGFDVWMEKQL
ncbi:MAG: GNAT family N-acetyltransferase [Candidatus Sifarchaeia archaeon]